MALTGYPVEDLALRGVVRRRVAAGAAGVWPRSSPTDGLGELVVVVGYLDGAPDAAAASWATPKGSPQNAAAIVHRGRVAGRYAKHHLPNYGVFDEYRYFVPGSVAAPWSGCTASTWPSRSARTSGRTADRSRSPREAGAGLLLVDQRLAVRAEQGRRPARARTPARRGGRLRARLREHGRRPGRAGLRRRLAGRRRRTATLLARARAVRRASCSWSTSTCRRRRPADRRAEPRQAPDGSATTIERIVLGRRAAAAPAAAGDGRRSRSGSTDEAEVYTRARHRAARLRRARTASAAVRARPVRRHRLGAVGRDRAATRSARSNVYGVSMPSAYSSEHSRDRRRRPGASAPGCTSRPCRSRRWSTRSSGAARTLDRARRGEPAGAGPRHDADGRCPTSTATWCWRPGNKSELAVGYSTIYGDAVGGFAPIKDVPKTLVWELARWRNADGRGAAARRRRSRRRRSARQPSRRAAARPARHRLAARRTTCSTTSSTTTSSTTAGPASCSRPASTRSWSSEVLRLVDRAEYKRRQYPPGPKISFKAFGRDRRLPITNRWQEHAPRR